ncbi:ABC transporter type 1, transmembrane domain-containing protein [Pilobolus umbonatus]|nr:ABC transporter type 1, transmembrane domain-containing protein [Pilobolus umbonatus]
MATPFCGCGSKGENGTQALQINSCYRESLLDALLPLLFFTVSCILFSISRYRKSLTRPFVAQDYLRLPTSKSVSVFRRSLLLLIFTLLEISCWAFLFAWRLESAILERSKQPEDECRGPPLYQVVDPGLAFIPRLYILILVIKSFTTPADPLDPSKFTRYSYHFLIFYSVTLISAIVRVFDYFFTLNNWFISSTLEKSFASIDLCLCFGLWFVTITSPSELDQGELVDFEEDDDGVLVLHDGRVVRNGRILSLESSASPLASFTFSWMNSLLSSSLKSRLTAASLWTLPMRQRARENYRLFAETTHNTAGKITKKGIIQRIFQSNRNIVLFQFITAIAAVLLHYANPFFLLKLLNFIQNYSKESGEKELGYMYCIFLFTCNVFSTLIASQTLLWGRRWHVAITHMLNSEVFAHALRLKRVFNLKKSPAECMEQDDSLLDEDEDKKLHQQASLMSQDTERLAELASYLHIFYTCPLEIAVGAIFLYKLLGNAFLAGLVVMMVALPSTHYINRRLMFVQTHLTDAKSWRIRLLRELCEGIKTIKFLATERTWEQAITNAREDELVKLIKLYTQNTILGLIWFATPVFVTTISFAWYTLVEKKRLDASTAFVSIVLFGMLRDPLNVMPQAFVAYTEANVSLQHITTFLNTEEKEDEGDDWQSDHPTLEEQSKVAFETSTFEWLLHSTTKQSQKHNRKHKPGNPAAEPIFDDSASYYNERYYQSIPRQKPHLVSSFRLNMKAFEFPPHVLSVITGPTQSGKSSLIAALLGNMPLTGGKKPMIPSRFLCYSNNRRNNNHTLIRDPMNRSLYLNKVAFVAQTPWIEHGTVRENILFSEPWDDARYRAVLHQCDLLRDLSLLENGDLTLIGERNSSSISESIQHKISLARAVYSKAKTIMIDDIFNVLGKVSSSHIYENCIRGELMNMRTLIVVATYPDLFWARDAKLLVNMELDSSEKSNHKEGSVDFIESDPEKIEALIKYRRQQKSAQQQEADDTLPKNMSQQDAPADVIDTLFEQLPHQNTVAAYSDDEFFDETSSIIPASSRQGREGSEEYGKSRDYAYATYFSACGGWKYWAGAILFTFMARVANISENYWLKEGMGHDTLFKSCRIRG